ncbi:MAG: hypothetical protein ACK5Q5_12190 [Planctomycetaceae bacterium]
MPRATEFIGESPGVTFPSSRRPIDMGLTMISVGSISAGVDGDA